MYLGRMTRNTIARTPTTMLVRMMAARLLGGLVPPDAPRSSGGTVRRSPPSPGIAAAERASPADRSVMLEHSSMVAAPSGEYAAPASRWDCLSSGFQVDRAACLVHDDRERDERPPGRPLQDGRVIRGVEGRAVARTEEHTVRLVPLDGASLVRADRVVGDERAVRKTDDDAGVAGGKWRRRVERHREGGRSALADGRNGGHLRRSRRNRW